MKNAFWEGIMDKVFIVRLMDALPLNQDLIEALPLARKEKALRYRQKEDQARSAVASLLMGMVEPLDKLMIRPSGKPYFPEGAHFNVSHSGSFIGIYVSDEPVGFDIEEIARCNMKIIPAAFTPEEAQDISSPRSLAFAWTRKEALAKCQGDGIRNPKQIGAIYVAESQYLYQNLKYYVSQFEIEDHVFALAKRNRIEKAKAQIISIEDLLKRQK